MRLSNMLIVLGIGALLLSFVGGLKATIDDNKRLTGIYMKVFIIGVVLLALAAGFAK